MLLNYERNELHIYLNNFININMNRKAISHNTHHMIFFIRNFSNAF